MAIFQTVNDGQTAFIDLVHDASLDTVFAQPGLGSAGRDDLETQIRQDLCGFQHQRAFVAVLDRDEHRAGFGQFSARTHLRLQESTGKATVPTHDFAGRAHFRPQQRVDTGEAGKGQHRLFHRIPRHVRIGQRQRVGIGQRAVVIGCLRIGRTQREVIQRLARHQTGRDRGNRAIRRLGHKRHGAAGTRVHFQQVDDIVLDRELHVHQADHVQRHRQLFGLGADLGDDLGAQGMGRQAAGAVARMDASFFDMLHDTCNMHTGAIAQGVNVNLGRARKIAVQQHGAVARHLHGDADIAVQLIHIAHDFHRAATQHVRRADHQRKADAACDFQRFGVRMGDAVDRLFQTEVFNQLLETLAVFGQVDGVGRCAEDGDARLLQLVRQFQRRLAAELHDHTMQRAVFLLDAQDFHDAFKGQRLEIQAVRGVVVGRDRLGVAVDHDRLVADFRQRETGVNTAIVEFDPLTDAVRATAQDHDFLAIRGTRLVLDLAHDGHFIGRIHVGGLGFEFGGAGVDPLEHGGHAQVQTGAAHVIFGAAGQLCQTRVREAEHFQFAQASFGHGQAIVFYAGFGVDDLADTVKEPRVEFGDSVDLVIRQAFAHGLGDGAQTVGGGLCQCRNDGGFRGRAGDGDLVKTGQAGFQRRQRLLHRFVEGAADGHHFADRLHGGGQLGLAAGEFFKGKARDLGHDVVDGRLERGGRDFGDIVVQLVQRVTHCQFRRDLGNRETGSLRGQRGRTRHAGVHLDHDHTAVLGVHRPLHVRAARLDADLAQHGDRAVAHDLVFFVGQRQGRGDGDAVAGVHAHRIDVLDRADDDGVIRFVADHFHLVFFPTQQRFIDQDLTHGRGIHAGMAVMFVFFAVIGHAAAGAAKGKGGADNGGQADLFQRVQRDAHAGLQILAAISALGGGDDGGLGVFQTDAVHRFAEQGAVFGHFNRVAVRADQLDAEFLQHAHIGQRQCRVQAGLAAHGRQQRVGALFLDDLGDDLGGDRLDIGRIGHFRVGHDRRGVRVHQNDAVALFAQGFTGLGTGIVKFTGLPDDDGPRPNDHDRLDVGSLRHGVPLGGYGWIRDESRPSTGEGGQIVLPYRQRAAPRNPKRGESCWNRRQAAIRS
ncbi:hypothetical protein KVU_0264 [Ketogulonicigenium vulgare WSH-001]|uniref:Uncharacterized protein n=1 Tax=Ketogulonicigenium vulgare (strain WSH-001) TaxID=759362 RepID=F9Y9C1_KETVW|nr:hypothetical protein KVU_0264 [Ketogulonicigenium vulgare WSH-001]